MLITAEEKLYIRKSFRWTSALLYCWYLCFFFSLFSTLDNCFYRTVIDYMFLAKSACLSEAYIIVSYQKWPGAKRSTCVVYDNI